MDGRNEGRFPAIFDVTISEVERPERMIPGRVANISGSGIQLILPLDVAPGSVLRLDVSGNSLFGHVVYAKPEGEEFLTGIELTRVLFGDNDLSKLLEAVLKAQMPAVAAMRED